VAPSLTYSDSTGDTRLRPWALPVVVALLVVPIVLAMLVGVATVEGAALGLAAGALAVAGLLVIAARARPGGQMEVAAHRDAERRLLVIATVEATPGAAQEIAARAGEAADVRLVVPVRSRRLDRWLSAEDRARHEAERMLAHSAGALVAAGLPVSGSVGDSDSAQALEDELRSYPADEVVLLTGEDEPDPLGGEGERLDIPLLRVSAG